MSLATLFLVLPMMLGCGGADPLLLVNLRSDLVPGVEVSRARVSIRLLDSRTPLFNAESELSAGVDLLGGWRLTELNVAPGTYLVRAELLDLAGEESVEREAIVDVREATSVTLLASRSCRGVVCAEGSTCQAGTCVDPRCSPESPESCPAPECAVVGDCPAPSSECMAQSCTSGICFAWPDSGLCPADASCSPMNGCEGAAPTHLLGVENLSAGGSHICAGSGDGVRCWGSNGSGQLGDGTSVDRSLPVMALSGDVFSGPLSAGGQTSCTVGIDGLLCWGDNRAGQLGQESPAQSSTPLLVPTQEFNLPSVGGRHTCSDVQGDTCPGPGICPIEMWCWGDNRQGQLGDGSLVSRSTPALALLTQPNIAALGAAHTCRLNSDLFCWGDNAFGQLGLGDTMHRSAPAAVSGRLGRVIGAGVRHTCSVDLNTGVLFCWGDNARGQLGLGTMGAMETSPVATLLATEAVSLALGDRHTCAIVADRSVWCWGDNDRGQLGVGADTAATSSPLQVDLGGEIAGEMTAGDAFTCVTLETDGRVLCWGANEFGQLGDGTNLDRATPAFVLEGTASP